MLFLDFNRFVPQFFGEQSVQPIPDENWPNQHVQFYRQFLERLLRKSCEICAIVPNLMKPNECPFNARTLEVNDWILDAEMFPTFVPAGLWKMIHVIKDEGNGHYYTMEMIFKVYEDGYF